ncbi:MAG: patatin, partial [Rhodoferax sp.]|nr:patatin [Rhodoferax sp.]
DADQPPVLHATETACLAPGSRRSEAAEILVLLHPAERPAPQGTALWLARRAVAGHLHIRPTLARDMARLARIQSRTAVGLVLAGGGARGFAHLGVYRALCERGIEIDCVGGTSIGAVMGTYIASDRPLDVVMANARAAFHTNPTGDFNLLPMLSLIKGLRLRGILSQAVQNLVGRPADTVNVEDLWKTFYCVATNYSTASEVRIEHGNLVQSLLASTSIPGALPPVIRGGELLCDGGTFNNFPVDAMRHMRGVGRVIGVDLNHRTAPLVTHADMPGTWALLRDRLRPPAARLYRLPSLPSYLMTVTILYSMSRQRAAQSLCDLYFHPPLTRVGMLQWNRREPIIQRGYVHALQVLDENKATQAGASDKPPGAS